MSRYIVMLQSFFQKNSFVKHEGHPALKSLLFCFARTVCTIGGAEGSGASAQIPPATADGAHNQT